MVKKLTMILAGLFLCVGMALAQSSVRGTVTSSEDGQPIVGASIKVVGTNTGTVTDVDGNFSLTVPSSSSRLQVSYIGMNPKTVKVSKNMNISLDPSNNSLDEVMVVAYGTQTKSSFAGSAAVVDAKDLSKKITTNVADALVGSVPGLQLTGASGAPGASQGSIHIRGIASLYASTDPLVIVDGAPYPGNLSNIPSEDIASVTVLKDATSAALYGARGAAGVILITTKRGNESSGRISVEAKWGGVSRSVQDYETITDPGEFMETYYKQFYNYAYYGKGLSNAAANAWVNKNMITGSWGLQYNPYTLPEGESLIGLDGKLNPNAKLGRAYDYNGETYYVLPDDWKDAAYKTGSRQEYNVSFNGGNSKGGYYSSVSYLNEDGVIDNAGYERLSGRLKADYQIRNWLRVGGNINYVHSNTKSNPNLSDTNANSTNMGFYTQYIAPIYPLYVRTVDANGNPVIRIDEYGHQQYDYGVPSSNFPGQGTRLFLSTGNPIGSNQYNDVRQEFNLFQGQFNFDVDITSYLKFSSVNSLNFSNAYYSDYENPFYGPTAGDNGRLIKESSNTFRQNYSQTLTFHKLFGQHDVQVMAGHEWYKTSSKYLDTYAKGGFSPDVKEIDAFSDIYDGHSNRSLYNVEGWFGNALYNYAEKYFGQASFRRDASSRFAKDHRWGTFWSVGGAWIISKEEFFKNLNADWVDNLKLKISIGQQGNDGIGSYNYLERYALSKGEGGMLPSFYAIGNEDITWETTTNFNVGLEFALLNNRLSGEFNFFNKKTTDALMWMSIPESYGARGYYGNMGDHRNTGIELTLTGDIIRTKNFTWTVTGNMTHYTTKVLKLPESKTGNYGGFSESKNSVRLWYEEGKPLYNAMLPEYAGVNEQGEALYWVDEDVAKSGISTTAKPGYKHSYTTTNWSEATYYEQGSILPKVNGGFSTTLKIYDFDVNANFDYQIGGKVYDHGYQELMSNISSASNANGFTYHKDILKSWTPNNTSSDIPRFQYSDQYTASSSTRFLTKANYLNFQSFSVGYTVPRQLLSKLFISNLRVYVQGENICFWSARKGLDPRYSFMGTTSWGIDSYAPVRTIMGGIQVTF